MTLTYAGRVFSSPTVAATFVSIYKLFGPSHPGACQSTCACVHMCVCAVYMRTWRRICCGRRTACICAAVPCHAVSYQHNGKQVAPYGARLTEGTVATTHMVLLLMLMLLVPMLVLVGLRACT